jgi:hypothetical protein
MAKDKITIEVDEATARAIEHLKKTETLNKEISKQRANGDRFAQINTKVLFHQAMKFEDLKDYQLMAYFYDRMNASNALIVSQAKLCKVLDCHRNTVRTVIKRLEELRYIDIMKVGVQNCYIINEQVAWKTGRDKKKNAIFSAVVVADWDEQLSEHFKHWTSPLQPVPRNWIDALASDKEDDRLANLKKQVSDFGLNNKKGKTAVDTFLEETRCDNTADMFNDDDKSS